MIMRLDEEAYWISQCSCHPMMLPIDGDKGRDLLEDQERCSLVYIPIPYVDLNGSRWWRRETPRTYGPLTPRLVNERVPKILDLFLILVNENKRKPWTQETKHIHHNDYELVIMMDRFSISGLIWSANQSEDQARSFDEWVWNLQERTLFPPRLVEKTSVSNGWSHRSSSIWLAPFRVMLRSPLQPWHSTMSWLPYIIWWQLRIC